MNIIYKDRFHVGDILSIKYGVRVFPYFSIEFISMGVIRSISFSLFNESVNFNFDIRIDWLYNIIDKLKNCFDRVEKKMSGVMGDMEVYYAPGINPIKFDGPVKIWGQKTTLGKSSDLAFKETVNEIKEHLDMCLDGKGVI